jgi:lipopolysaccharide/colanic/teichoic acid biosynthesis glycosyltransferase
MLQVLLFFPASPAPGRKLPPWDRVGLVTLGSDPAIVHYLRLITRLQPHTRLVVPAALAPLIADRRGCEGRVITCSGGLGGWKPRRLSHPPGARETLLVDARWLPAIDVAAALRAHRRERVGMSVFHALSRPDYCCERVIHDAFGAVNGAARSYRDSAADARPPAVPLAAILSRGTFQPDPAAGPGDFSELIGHLESRIARAGEGARHFQHPSVRPHEQPLRALLFLCAALGSEPERAEPGRAGGGIRGPVILGRDVRVAPGAVIIGPAAVGDFARLAAGAIVSHAVIPPGRAVAAEEPCHATVAGPGGAEFGWAIPPTQMPNTSHESRADRPLAHARRGLDVALAAAGLLLLGPLLVAIALLVRLTSPGPVFFRHRRQGRGGVEFDCLKFRTMCANAAAQQSALRARNEVDGPQFKLARDPRVTRFGALLRRSNLDELPQLFNVLAGDMSLVGPRPSPDAENQFCPAWRKARLSVRPGITGLWQVTRSADRRLADFQEWIHYDMQYVARQSLRLDAGILWQTLRILLRLGPGRRWAARWEPEVRGSVSVLPAPGVRPAGPLPASADPPSAGQPLK